VRVVTEFDRPIWDDDRRTVVTIGAYDGLHIGHRSVIDQVRSIAERTGAQSGIVTFDRHPAHVVRPDSAPCLLTDPSRRIEMLSSTGIDVALIVTFDEHQAAEAPEAFVERVLVDAASVSAVVVGEDFHFGRARTGNLELLADLGRLHDFEVHPIALVAHGAGQAISSTAIRAAVSEGRVDEARAMLGRPYELTGTVSHGDHRGRTIGVPTANIAVPAGRCSPAPGVYAGWYERPGGQMYDAAINIGWRPTFDSLSTQMLIEAHLIGVDIDLYGENGRVHLVEFLRVERRFDGIESLSAQLVLDIEQAAKILESQR
jgi:riboflavin kinase/FMN adenylyltransferase